MIKQGFFMMAAALLLASCVSSGNQWDSGKSSYSSVRKAVVNQLPLGVRKVSENGREYDSGYFVPQIFKFELDATKDKRRATAHIKILGDSRPYIISVEVHIEVQQPDGSYMDFGTDEKLTDELTRRIQVDLAHRQDEINVIDQFRAF